jgi:hypothetical protein
MARRPIRTTCRPGGRSISSSVRVCAGRSPQWPRGVVRARSQSRGTEPVNEADCAVQLGEGLAASPMPSRRSGAAASSSPPSRRNTRSSQYGTQACPAAPAVEADQRLLIDEPSSPPTLTGWRQGMVVRNGLTAGWSRIRTLSVPQQRESKNVKLLSAGCHRRKTAEPTTSEA